MNCAKGKIPPEGGTTNEVPAVRRVDNFKLYRHDGQEGAEVPNYVCHECGREHLKVEEMETLYLQEPYGGGKSAVGPSNTCKKCWARFQAENASRAAAMNEGPWPPAWSRELFEAKKREEEQGAGAGDQGSGKRKGKRR